MMRCSTVGCVALAVLATGCSSRRDERERASGTGSDPAGANAPEASPPRPPTPDEILQAELQRAARAPQVHAQGLEAESPPVAAPDPADGDAQRQRALRDAAEFGLTGLLDPTSGGDPNGRGDGIGLGNVGTLGHGAGTGTGQGFGPSRGRLGGSHRARPPQVRMGATQVSGRLPPEVIQRIVRQNFGRFRMCYEAGLRNNPNLQGRVTVEFVIGKDGSVPTVKGAGDLPDPSVISCISRQFYGLSFPQPEGGIVKVSYPIVFTPGDDAPAGSSSAGAGAGASASASVGAGAGASASASASASVGAGAGAGAGAESAPEPGPSAPAPAWPAATATSDSVPPAAPLGTVAERDRLPVVVIDGTRILVDGVPVDVPVDTTRVLEDAGRLQKVDGVFDALRARRERWKSEHDTHYPGVCGLRLSPDVPLLIAKSVFQTIAFAGHGTIVVQLSGEPATVIPLVAQIPGPPTTDAAAEPATPPRVAHARLEAKEYVFTWQQGSTVVSEWRVPADAADLAPKLCADWKHHEAPEHPSGARAELVLHGDNRDPFRALLPLVTAAQACTRPARDGAAAPAPAFFLTFSIR